MTAIKVNAKATMDHPLLTVQEAIIDTIQERDINISLAMQAC